MTHYLNPKRDYASVSWLQSQDKKQIKTIADHSVPANQFHDPREWMRVRQAARCFSIGRSTLYKLLNKGLVKSVSIKNLGALRGIRLINADSVRNYLDNLA